jgi:hypothetical protein
VAYGNYPRFWSIRKSGKERVCEMTKRDVLLIPKDQMLKACADLIDGDCDGANQLNFMVGLSRHLAERLAGLGEGSSLNASGMTLARRIFAGVCMAEELGIEATKTTARRRQRSLAPTVVKGQGLNLTATQRELIDVFIWYLRQLPPYDEAQSWNSPAYSPVNQIITKFYRAKFPELPFKNIEELPADDEARFTRLMREASTPEDAGVKRQREILRLARQKRQLLKDMEAHQRARAGAGLDADPAFAAAAATPLEIAAERTWGHAPVEREEEKTEVKR